MRNTNNRPLSNNTSNYHYQQFSPKALNKPNRITSQLGYQQDNILLSLLLYLTILVPFIFVFHQKLWEPNKIDPESMICMPYNVN